MDQKKDAPEGETSFDTLDKEKQREIAVNGGQASPETDSGRSSQTTDTNQMDIKSGAGSPNDDEQIITNDPAPTEVGDEDVPDK